jgi:hypothetical protein
MPTLILKGKITKGYNHWLAAYDGAEEHRKTKYGITTIYRGQDMNDSDTIHIVMHTPSMEAIEAHIVIDADLIAEAGGDPSPEANSMFISSD